MNQPTPDGGAPSLRARPGFVAVVLAIAVLAGALEISPASIALLVSERLGVDTGAVSWLVSVMLGVAVVASVPAGRAVHRLGPRRALAAASALLVAGGVASWWFATRGDYALVFLARVVAGGGFILVWNAGLGAFGAFAERATATSLFTASGPLGFAVGHLSAPLLADAFGWASPFLVYPLLIVVPALALAAVRAPAGADADGDAPTLGEVRSLLATRAFVLVAAMAFVSYSLYLFVNSWVPTYLDAVLGYSATQSGALVAAFPLLGAFSRLSGGLVADRVFDGERRPVVLASFLVSGPLLAAFLVVERSAVVLLALVVTGYLVQLSLGLFYSYVPDVLDAHLVTNGVAVLSSVGLAGAFLAPIVAGVLVDVGGYALPFAYVVVLAVVGAALAFVAGEPGR